MRCRACNVALNNYEATKKDVTGEFLDLCRTCHYAIRKELNNTNNINTKLEDVDNEI